MTPISHFLHNVLFSWFCRRIWVFVPLFLVAMSARSQNVLQPPSFHPFSIHVGGTYLGFAKMGALEFEYVIDDRDKRARLAARLSAIHYNFFGFKGPMGGPSLALIVGRDRNFFDCDGGLVLVYDKAAYEYLKNDRQQRGLDFNEKKSDYYYIWPAFHLGYRYQKEEGRLIFRMGVGFPKIVHMSLGLKI